MSERERIHYFDVLRVAACFAVIVIHSLGGELIHYLETQKYFVRIFIDSTTRFCVPAFLMISGAIYLSRDIRCDLRYYWKIFYNYVVPTFAGLALMKFVELLRSPDQNLFRGVFYDVFSSTALHLWFMWMYIGIVLCLPILSAISRDKKTEMFFILAWFFFTSCVETMKLFNVQFPVDNPLFFKYTGYFFLGHYLHSYVTIKNRALLVGLALASYASIALLTIASCKETKSYIKFFVEAPSPVAPIYSVFIFLLCKTVFTRDVAVFRFMAQFTLFIYIVHFPILKIARYLFVSQGFESTNFSDTILLPSLVFLVSLLAAWSFSWVRRPFSALVRL